jgi:outer membrane protein
MKFKLVFLAGWLFSVLLTVGQVQAQEILTLEEAIRVALERNYQIRISANELEIDKNNVNRANAGMIPAVTGNFTNNNTLQNSRQERADGQITERNNARGSSLNYGVSLNWTIFDGFGMFARYDQLKELESLGEVNLQLTILNRVSEVINHYFALVQQQQQVKANLTAIGISRFRVKTAQNRFEIGKAARLEVLNALVDLNTDTTNLLRQQEQYQNTKVALNELLARDVQTPFAVVDTMVIDEQLLLEQLSQKALQQNPTLQAALISKRIAQLQLKSVKAARLPRIGVTTGYNFNENQSALGFAVHTSGRGLNYGLTASINVFNGFLQRRNERNASVLINNAELEHDRVVQSVKAQLAAAYQTYQTNLALVKLEESNQQLAKRNLDITLDKFRLGSIAPIEFREAQLNYLNSRIRFSTAQYQAKVAEIALKEIAGNVNL